MVQRSTVRYVKNDYHYTSSVTNMLREIVVYSRATQKSSQSHNATKMHNKPVNVDHSHITTTQNNKFLIPYSKTKHHMNSFFPRVVRLRNELPTEIKDAPTIPTLASGLNKCYALN